MTFWSPRLYIQELCNDFFITTCQVTRYLQKMSAYWEFIKKKLPCNFFFQFSKFFIIFNFFDFFISTLNFIILFSIAQRSGGTPALCVPSTIYLGGKINYGNRGEYLAFEIPILIQKEYIGFLIIGSSYTIPIHPPTIWIHCGILLYYI